MNNLKAVFHLGKSLFLFLKLKDKAQKILSELKSELLPQVIKTIMSKAEKIKLESLVEKILQEKSV
jgi:hypothetical protein